MDMDRTDATSTYGARSTDMDYDDRRSSMDPRMIIAAVAGLALVVTVILLVATPRGRRVQLTAGKRLEKMNKSGRKQIESALHQSRKELAQLEKDSRRRVGDLKHRAKVMRMKAGVRKLEEQLMH